MKTGSVKVLSTAIMSALMEEASCNALDKAKISNGKASVGVSIDLVHRRPSAIGAHVHAVAKLTENTPKGIFFEIEAFDETGLIGTAKHRRVFVDQEAFEKKCYEASKKAQQNK
ncbi:hypothetical protein TRFO_01934 [Tritrichomonas foetus]|uniref:Fluoroacetyl-CoA-specific thioesterase-like domain-containing protein n=1 Tax=Tritrichomonas foetus TaxID=1144522 RepID=A0A1J4JI54_9EUKA|nr:hypothetical protein TRFO_01934 [Tritrichomonas foetus]|eukprot:OHS98850.1 hypothetical protein TRFO_01934 [Tritrichomonas foetus]